MNILSVSGGELNDSFQIVGKENNYFIKINSASKLVLFKSEVLGLNALLNTNTFKAPTVIAVGQFNDYSYLILENLKLQSSGGIKKFAVALACLHKNISAEFGFN